ncbi:MAG: aminotransferase [Deltaproteobacteria bacterium HGW-Deltaproteobacteria-4]|nr:MAG: aminotransferase [Deltaproteobacteria bacterium HGW-Deltaproteobacteria-4]
MRFAPFKLERYFAQYEFTAPYLLCSSDCESMRLDELLALEPDAREQFDSLWLGYTESLGDPQLRQVITTLYEKIGSDQVLVHAGAEEAIFNFMNVALFPGDHVVVHAPYYQSLGAVAEGIGAVVSEWRGDPSRAWELDLVELERLLTPRTRVVVVNFPHNPTGYLPTLEFARGLSALSDRHGFVIFADEVYRGLEFDAADRLPAFAELNERAVSLGVMSKTYGLAGLRIGWVVTQDDTLFAKLASFKDYTTISNSAPSEFLATLALRHAGPIVERNLRIIRDNLLLLDSFFAVNAERFDWQRPKAGSIAFPTLLQGKVDDFCADLVKEAGVLLLPGSLYGEGYNSFRIGFGRKNLPDALAVLEDHLRGSR